MDQISYICKEWDVHKNKTYVYNLYIVIMV